MGGNALHYDPKHPPMIEVLGRRLPVIDGHVHVFPDDIRLAREAFVERDGWFAELYSPEKAKLASTEELIASMDRSGVDGAILCGFPWRHAEMCRLHNLYMLESVAAYPDRLSWLGIASPIDDGEAEARWCLANGAVGIGELNADAQGFRWTDADLLMPIAATCAAAGRPMLVHGSEPVGHPYPGKGTATPDQLLALATIAPDVDIVAAHWGGGLPFYELMPEVRTTLTRVVYDCAATSYLYALDVFPTVINLVGSSKVMFGSDFPVLGQGRLLTKVAALPWASVDDAAMVLAGTAERLFGMGGS